MITCCACGYKKIDPAKQSMCPLCQMPLLGVTIDSLDDQEAGKSREKLSSLGRQYRIRRLGGIRVGLLTARYGMKNGQPQLTDEQELNLCGDASVLEPEEMEWCDIAIAPLPEGSPLILKAFWQKENQEICTQEVSLKAPAAKGDWKVAILLTEGLAVRFVLGNETEYSCSDPVFLIRRNLS